MKRSGGAEALLAPWEVDWCEPSALLVGNEGAGLPEEVERSADARIRIPMASGVESLNAAAAAAVLFYEAARQRKIVRWRLGGTSKSVSLFQNCPEPIEPEVPAAHQPLAERMRPRTLDEFIGQEKLLAPGKPLRTQIENDDIGSMLLVGAAGLREDDAGEDDCAADELGVCVVQRGAGGNQRDQRSDGGGGAEVARRAAHDCVRG